MYNIICNKIVFLSILRRRSPLLPSSANGGLRRTGNLFLPQERNKKHHALVEWCFFISDVERVRLLAAERAEELIQVQYLGALLRNDSASAVVIPRQLCCEEPLLS